MQIQESTRYILARNEWSASHILKRVRQGRIPEESVLFKTEKEVYGRRSRMRPVEQAKFSVFKINFTTHKDK